MIFPGLKTLLFMKQMATQIQDGNLSFEMQGVNQTDMY